MLTNHLLEDIRGEHIEAPADYLGYAKVGDDQGKNHKTGADQAVLGPWQGDRQEHAGLGGAQGVCRFIQPRIRHGECRQQNHQCVRKAVKHLGQHDAKRPVDRHPKHPVLQKTLVAKQVDQRDGRQQRGRQNRDQRQRLKQTLEAHATALQRVGIHKGQRQHDGRGEHGNKQAVPD